MNETVPGFFTFFTPQPNISNAEQNFDKFCRAIELLHSHYNNYHEITFRASFLCSQSKCSHTELNKWFRAALFSQLPLRFDRMVFIYFEYSFRVFSGTMAANEQDSEMNGELAKDDVACHICETESNVCKCTAVLNAFQLTNQKLREMGLMERMCGPSIGSLVEQKIVAMTAELCQGMLRSNSRLLENWLEKVVLEWVRKVYPCDGKLKNFQMDKFTSLQRRLDHFLWETYARIIIDQFFNIIIGTFVLSYNQM